LPLGRQGSVDEIAATCLFLVSEDGGFITVLTGAAMPGRGEASSMLPPPMLTRPPIEC
jgi:hypothetical protein